MQKHLARQALKIACSFDIKFKIHWTCDSLGCVGIRTVPMQNGIIYFVADLVGARFVFRN